jgi:cell division protein FtsB
MAKDPAFLFYSQDFLTGCTDLTMEERGQYITLLCLQHQKGRLTDKSIKLAVGVVSKDVLTKFIVDGEGFYNKRLEEEVSKRRTYCESRRNNRLSKTKEEEVSEDMSEHMLNHMSSHMENENEDVINKEEKKKKESERKEEKKQALQNLVKRREQIFRNAVMLQGQYPDDMLKKFSDYWTELNRSGTKMRYELEPVFQIGRRLATWASRDRVVDRKPVEDNITFKELVRRFNQGETDIWDRYEPIAPGDKRTMWKLKTKT